MEQIQNEIVLFETVDREVSLQVQMGDETVWLTRNQMAELFDRDVKTIGKHIHNALSEELESATVAKFATVQKEGDRDVTREIEYYNLDMIRVSIFYISGGMKMRAMANIEPVPGKVNEKG